MKSLSCEKSECNLRSVGQSHGKFDEWKSFQVGRNVLWVEIESVEVKVECYNFEEFYHFKNWFGNEKVDKFDIRSSFSHKN